MSSTRIIYVSKDKAEVQNDLDGTFLNKVDDGIIIKVGDEISIEGIAINSTGVGNDIIEIPSKVQNYQYLTNRMKLNCMMYINHDYLRTCMLPLSNYNSVYTTITDDNYGYYNATNTLPALPLHTNAKSKLSVEGFGGKRFYIGAYGLPITYGATPEENVYNPFVPIGANAVNPITDFVPSLQPFNLCETELEFGVDIGYDAPANIANKITQDFHGAEVSPQNSVLNPAGMVATEVANIGFTPALNQLAMSTINTAVVSGNGLPAYVDSAVGFTIYSGLIGCINPFYNFYGSRLLNENPALGGQPKNNSYLSAQLPSNPPHDTDIYVIGVLPQDATNTHTEIPRNYILNTNLPFNETSLKQLRGFMLSQKYLDINANDKLTTAQLNDPVIRQSYLFPFDFGRHDDAQATAGIALQSPATLPATPACIVGQLNSQATFNKERIDASFLGAGEIFNGMFKDLDVVIPFEGKQMRAIDILKKLDICVIPVNTGSLFGNNEVNCGFVMNFESLGGTSILNTGNYGLIDLSFFNPNNPQLQVMQQEVRKGGSDTDIANYTRFMNFGAPNIAMVFDGTRGRFGFSDMSWANILNNRGFPTPAPVIASNPSAGQQAITTNCLVDTTTYASVGIVKQAFTKYSQTGLGIRNISVIKNDGSNESVEIDYYDAEDVKNKFSGGLLRRLGFDYYKLINRNGIPDAIFIQRTFNSIVPRRSPQYFPYPLTTNLRFDTALSDALSVNNSNLPMFDTASQRSFLNINIQAESDVAFASNLPQKLVFPYWLIKSDIIDGVEFNSGNGGKKQNIMAICNRAYLSGDFAFSFATDYAFKATKEFVLTSINTAILNPDLTPADIDPKTSILYKIKSPIPFFTLQEQAEQQAQLAQQQLQQKKKKSKK